MKGWGNTFFKCVTTLQATMAYCFLFRRKLEKVGGNVPNYLIRLSVFGGCRVRRKLSTGTLLVNIYLGAMRARANTPEVLAKKKRYVPRCDRLISWCDPSRFAHRHAIGYMYDYLCRKLL